MGPRSTATKPASAVAFVPQLAGKDDDELREWFRDSPVEFASAMLARELVDRLTTQLFYSDRWKGKFKRHGAAGSAD